jgi:hypothetical protein
MRWLCKTAWAVATVSGWTLLFSFEGTVVRGFVQGSRWLLKQGKTHEETTSGTQSCIIESMLGSHCTVMCSQGTWSHKDRDRELARTTECHPPWLCRLQGHTPSQAPGRSCLCQQLKLPHIPAFMGYSHITLVSIFGHPTSVWPHLNSFHLQRPISK